MVRTALFSALAVVLVSTGCVPVSEPVGAVEKAEPDKGLVGTWVEPKCKGPLTPLFQFEELTIDVPGVKGNAKGLMRAVTDKNDGDLWFYASTVGKQTYANMIPSPGQTGENANFSKKGEFAKWKGTEGKRFFIFRYALTGDKLAIDCGNLEQFTKLMAAANVTDGGTKYVPHFLTPADWFPKALGKDGAEKVFDGTSTIILKRAKK